MTKDCITSLFDVFTADGPGMILFDDTLKLHRANPSYSQILGYSESEMMELNHGDLIHPDALDEFHRLLTAVRTSNRPSAKYRKRLLHKNGYPVCVDETVYPIPAPCITSGNCFLSLVEQAACDQTGDSEQWLAMEIIRTMTDGLIVTNSDFKIVKANQAMSEITGFSADELLGKPPIFLTSKDQNSSFYRNMRVRLKQVGNWQGEIQHRRKNGEIVPLWLRLDVIKDRDGKVAYYSGIFSDISSQVELRENLRHLAHHDALTDLPNRLLFHDRLKMAIRRADRTERGVALLFIDLDGFKKINDECGHTIGDAILIEVAKRLKQAVRDEDTVARFGGDEFTILVTGASQQSDAAVIAVKIMDSISQPIEVQGREFSLTVSIGIGIYPDDASTPDELIMKADTAMYDIKYSGCNDFLFFDEDYY
jgi:diguanylate cyclase (GGDEF)-like protein/PAS domain S-box-containing protein